MCEGPQASQGWAQLRFLFYGDNDQQTEERIRQATPTHYGLSQTEVQTRGTDQISILKKVS